MTIVDVLILSGSMGSGKTTVLGEISDLLKAARVPHAAIDLDWLAEGWLPGAAAADLMYRNLTSVWTNFASAGVSRAVIAEPIDSRAIRDRITEAIPGARLVICRLRASLATMQARVRTREPGMLQDRHVARVAELEALLDRAALEDFCVANDQRPIAEVAREVLARAGW
jgi:predicted kinase